ncbi:MAG: hypothetical protein HRT89_17340 [Lentisphaeria bacterium]|nr:hypothetical protein [Lentisphaeria bacterium]NQZ69823.1 hypothetical protein [Lentisphaeria bacterium]
MSLKILLLLLLGIPFVILFMIVIRFDLVLYHLDKLKNDKNEKKDE